MKQLTKLEQEIINRDFCGDQDKVFAISGKVFVGHADNRAMSIETDEDDIFLKAYQEYGDDIIEQMFYETICAIGEVKPLWAKPGDFMSFTGTVGVTPSDDFKFFAMEWAKL